MPEEALVQNLTKRCSQRLHCAKLSMSILGWRAFTCCRLRLSEPVAELYLVRRQHDLVKRQGIALIAVLISAPLVSAESIRPSIGIAGYTPSPAATRHDTGGTK